jgi:hypothetical protein
MEEINQQAIDTDQPPCVCTKRQSSSVPSVGDTTQQVEETSPSSGASPNEDGGLWTLLVQLKERILASGRRMGPVILNVFNKFKNAIWQGCVSVYGIVYDLCCLLFFCILFVCFILYLCLAVLGLIPWTICAIVYGRLTGANLVSFKFTRSANQFSFAIEAP